MANHKSAIKRHKQSLNRAARNRAALTLATSVLAKAAGKGALHWKKAARKISRLARAVNGIEAE